MNAKDWIARLLIGFVLLSIGFSLGRETARRSSKDTPIPQPLGQDKVIVYYMHQTFRCVTCNKIEAMTGEILTTDFAPELKSGQLEWKQLNFQDHQDLAKKYNVASSCVVLVKIRAGQEIAHQKLDDVWLLIDDRPEFTSYLTTAIRTYLEAQP